MAKKKPVQKQKARKAKPKTKARSRKQLAPRRPQEEYSEARMPWDRAHGESEKAFEAFRLYRDMGLERTTTKVAAEVHKSAHFIRRWCAEWKWKERVEAWDVEQDRIERQRSLIEVRKMRKRHAETGMLLMGKALQKLAMIQPVMIKQSELVKFIELGAKLEARARGEPEEHTQHDIAAAPGQKIVQTFTICGKTIEF